jgi:hypothetical protein
MKYKTAKKICEKFALEHKIIFDEEGECGFGRKCVGFNSGDSWIDHNPINNKTYKPIKKFACVNAMPPEGVNCYHKHNCLAVLGRGEEAVIQLATWVKSMQKAGRVTIVKYPKNPSSALQALFTGIVGRTVVIEEK